MYQLPCVAFNSFHGQDTWILDGTHHRGDWLACYRNLLNHPMMARVLECSLAKGGHRKACKYCGELELVPSTACAVQYGEPYHARAAAVKRDPPLPHDQLGQQRLRSNPAVMRVPPSISACAATVARTFHDSHVLPRGQVRKLSGAQASLSANPRRAADHFTTHPPHPHTTQAPTPASSSDQ